MDRPNSPCGIQAVFPRHSIAFLEVIMSFRIREGKITAEQYTIIGKIQLSTKNEQHVGELLGVGVS